MKKAITLLFLFAVTGGGILKLNAQCITTYPYSEGFETNAAWTPGGTNSDWAWGTPAHPSISTAGGGAKSWCVGGLTGSFYSFSEQSWLQSPCFNFSTLTAPWISFKIYWECERQWDGMTLQSSVNGGITWQNVGAFGDPVNCMNDNWLTNANPKHGWSGRSGPTVASCSGGFGSNGWVTAKHCMPNLAGQPNVIFRFLFGSGTTCNSYDGMAVDDIYISNAPSVSPTVAFTCAGGNTINFTCATAVTPCTTSYSWNFGDPSSAGLNTSTLQNPSHTFTATGTYTVSLTTTGPCNATTTVTTAVSILTASTSVVNVNCNGANNGSATAIVTGGTGPFNYAWSPSGGNAATATGLAPGTYVVTITGANNCPVTATAIITQPPAITAVQAQLNSTCNGICNGSASVIASGGNGSYTYLWSPSGGTGSTASGLCPGAYTCAISSPAGCTVTQSFTITQPPAITVTQSQGDIACNGSCNGSASVIASGGNGSYTYLWSPSGQTTSTATGLCAGSYICTISSPAGCMRTSSFTITQPPVITATQSQVDVTCNGSCNGSASVVASGGNGVYTYLWSPGGQTTSTATGLCAGPYTCLISSPAGCSITKSFTIAQPPVITASQAQLNVTCNGSCNGSASVIAAGGTGVYSYLWTPSGQTSFTATGLCAGPYTCLISSPAGCSITKSFTITEPPLITATQSQVNVTCNGNCNGSASVVASGGTGVYTYLWSPGGQTTATATGLCAGPYTCLISSPAGCSITQSFTITEPAPLSLSISSTASTCGNTNGTASVVASGGVASYTYSWSPAGGSGATASGLSAGPYTVAVTDFNNCTSTATVTVSNVSGPSASISALTNVSCFGGNNGSITVTPTGGANPLTYVWSPSGGNDSTATGLIAGVYSVLVTDANGCTVTASGTITQPPALTISGTSSNVTCFGTATGTASVIAGGGSPSYSYLWTPSGHTTANETGLVAGPYSCAVTDANGCTITQSFNITEPPQLTLAISGINVSCFNSCNGQVSVAPSGGVPNYNYTWNTGCNTPACNNVCSGSYNVIVTDANGCVVMATTTITQPSAISITTSGVDAGCSLPNGAASATATGGTGTLNYQWIGGPANAAYTNLSQGTYSVIVTDANSCSDTAAVTINNINSIAVNLVSVTDVTCFNGNNGAMTINATGNGAPYTYNWSPNVSASTAATGITAGNYQVIVIDSNGCTDTVTATVNQPAQLTIAASANPSAVCAGTNVQLSSNATGGTPAYNYTWNPGNSAGNTQNILPVVTSTYIAYVTDANGCSDSTTVTVTVNPDPVPQFSSDVVSGCAPLCVTFTDNSTVTAPGMINSWSWDFGDNTPEVSSQNPQHCYTTAGAYTVVLTVATAGGCTSTLTMPAYINAFATPVAAFGATPQPASILNPKINFTDASVNATSWSWNFGDLLNSSSALQNPTFSYSEPVCYQVTLTVSNVNGCTDVATQEICIQPEVTLYVPNAFTPNGDGQNDVFFPKGTGLDWNTFNMMIFDRWGNLIYETTDINKGWNGAVKNSGEVVQQDVYVWKIDMMDLNGETHNLIGHVLLTR